MMNRQRGVRNAECGVRNKVGQSVFPEEFYDTRPRLIGRPPLKMTTYRSTRFTVLWHHLHHI